jgi:hypothetical protein
MHVARREQGLRRTISLANYAISETVMMNNPAVRGILSAVSSGGLIFCADG